MVHSLSRANLRSSRSNRLILNGRGSCRCAYEASVSALLTKPLQADLESAFPYTRAQWHDARGEQRQARREMGTEQIAKVFRHLKKGDSADNRRRFARRCPFGEGA